MVNHLHFKQLLASKSKQLKQWSTIIQDCVYPPTCLLCSDPGFRSLDLCTDCYHNLPVYQSGCHRCAAPLASQTGSTVLCADCQKQLPAFDSVHAGFHYQEPIRQLIHQLKFAGRFANARLLGYLIAEQLQETITRPQAIIPVPLHIKRYRQRTFNQSIELSRHLSNQLQIPLALNICKRNRNTTPQAELNARQRRRNLARTFTTSNSATFNSVAIVDDVMTTGSTVRSLASSLKRSGIQHIQVWVIARA